MGQYGTSKAPPCDASCPRSDCEEELVCGTSSDGPNLKRCTPATWGELTGRKTQKQPRKDKAGHDLDSRLLKRSPLTSLQVTDLKCVILQNNYTLKLPEAPPPTLVNLGVTIFSRARAFCVLMLETYWTAWSKPSERWGTTSVGVLGTIRSSSS